MSKLFVLLLSSSILIGCGDSYIVSRTEVRMACEEAYFEGQKDALSGDVKIKLTSDSCWVWTETCWNDGVPPLFNPSNVCDGLGK